MGRFRIGRLDGVVQIALAVALVVAVVRSCQPAGAGADALLYRQCEQHLRLCGKCRARGVTPARMVRQETPTRCLAFGVIEGSTREGDE